MRNDDDDEIRANHAAFGDFIVLDASVEISRLILQRTFYKENQNPVKTGGGRHCLQYCYESLSEHELLSLAQITIAVNCFGLCESFPPSNMLCLKQVEMLSSNGMNLHQIIRCDSDQCVRVCAFVLFVSMCVSLFVFVHWHPPVPFIVSRTLFCLCGTHWFGEAWKYIFSYYTSYHHIRAGTIDNICVYLTHNSQPFSTVSFIMWVGREAATATTPTKRNHIASACACACACVRVCVGVGVYVYIFSLVCFHSFRLKILCSLQLFQYHSGIIFCFCCCKETLNLGSTPHYNDENEPNDNLTESYISWMALSLG